MQTAGLSLDQAPPLAVPFGFFVVVPSAVLAAGALLIQTGAPVLAMPGTPFSIGLTHLGTLGFLGSAMLGALYQMTPVVSGQRVRGVRLAHLVQLLWVGGALGLVGGVLGSHSSGLAVGAGALGVGGVLFLVPTAAALARADLRDPTVAGMLLSLLGFAALLVAGGLLAGDRALGWGLLLERWLACRTAHMGIALTVWVGPLIAAVSWKVLPMFYLAEEVPLGARRVVLLLGGLSALAVPLVVLLGGPVDGVRVFLAAAAVAAWGVHPVLAWRSLSRRKRKRPDPSVGFWQLGLVCGGLTGLASLASITLMDPRVSVLVGWLAIWGWAGAIVHGMLGRIVPFLVWFHRFSAHVGLAAVPSMRKLLPREVARRSLWLHGATLGVGVVAILSRVDLLARLTGVGLVLTSLSMFAAAAAIARTTWAAEQTLREPPVVVS